jgi:hypothetical protein
MDETAAYHEAGHAFAAVVLGARVLSVTITPDRDDGPERFGDTQIEWDHAALDERTVQQRLVLVALAGPVAEMIYTGEPYHPGFVPEWAADWKLAWEAAAPLFADERQRLTLVEQAASEMHARLKEDENWAAVAAIADELLAHEWLDGDVVHNVIAAWR